MNKIKAVANDSTSFLDAWINHNDASFHNFEADEALAIRQALLTWYRQHRRKLPWRGDPSPWDGSTVNFADRSKTKQKRDGKQISIKAFFGKQEEVQLFPVTAYGVWVSEIMLQQTRVEAVVPYWVRWMAAFPTVTDLANASEDDVNSHWAGLGFYRRAKLLHKAAKFVVQKLDGEMPNTVEGLVRLDGVGRYTASAIASIAFNITVPVVDGNVCRVISRLRAIAQNVKAKELKDDWGWTLAAQIVQAGDGSAPGEVNQALMELGATYCAPSGTGTEPGDPLREYYWSTRLAREYGEAIETDNKKSPFKASEEPQTDSESLTQCPICAVGGLAQVLDTFASSNTSIATPISHTKDGSIGHSAFPLPPPRTFRIEEVYAVAVLFRQLRLEKGDEEAVLLIRRLDKGLLAGQWEFPSALVWTSENPSMKRNVKRQDMSQQVPVICKSVRQRALDSLLNDLASNGENIDSTCTVSSIKRSHLGDTPIEHVFSHVRHTLWVEFATLAPSDESSLKWTSSVQGRELRWMVASDLERVGLTSGVKKILRAVKQSTKSEHTTTLAKKRKATR